MKRFWLGVGLLAALLLLGIAATVGVRAFCRPLKAQLRQAQQAAMEEDWDKSLTRMKTGRAQWRRHRELCAAMIDHAPLEKIDSLFDALEVFGAKRDAVRFAQTCAELRSLTEAVEEAQAVKWWNIF